MQNDQVLRKACSLQEIAQQVHSSYEGWIKRSLQPDADEFIQECTGSLMATVKECFHLVVLDGLELKDLDQVELGTISICRRGHEVAERRSVRRGNYGGLDRTRVLQRTLVDRQDRRKP